LLTESIEILENAEGVAHLTRNRRIQVNTAFGEVDLLTLDLPDEGYASYNFREAGKDPWNSFDTQQSIVVSEPLSNRLALSIGDKLMLPSPKGDKIFEIKGVFYDYSSERGHAIIHRNHLEKFWEDPRVNSVALYLEDGWNPERFQDVFDQLKLPQPLIMRSNVSLREVSLEIFDRTFAITSVLRGCAQFFDGTSARTSERVGDIACHRNDPWANLEISDKSVWIDGGVCRSPCNSSWDNDGYGFDFCNKSAFIRLDLSYSGRTKCFILQHAAGCLRRSACRPLPCAEDVQSPTRSGST
jgi:hypothetical protein